MNGSSTQHRCCGAEPSLGIPGPGSDGISIREGNLALWYPEQAAIHGEPKATTIPLLPARSSPRQSLNISTGNAWLAQGCWSQAEVLKLENWSLALFDFSCFPFAGWIPTLNQWEAIKWSHCSLLPWFSWVNKREGIGLCRHKVKLKAKILFGIHRKIVYNLCYP